jgi:signal-transduction protein with cAMP-binding, CBS, and nucleotidyltransferase domain
MGIGNICNRRIPIAEGGTSVLAAAKCMQAFDAPILVVVDEKEGKRVAVGIVTERELARNVVAQGMDPSRLALKDVMRVDPGFVNEADDVYETACWMHRNRLKEAIVHDDAGGLAGLVTLEQLIDNLAGEIAGAAELPASDQGPPGHISLH